MKSIEQLRKKLSSVSDSYPEFVECIIEDCDKYADLAPDLCRQLLQYIDSNPKASSSEILDRELDLIGVPYGDDKTGKWFRWGKEISEKEAQKIVDKYYSE